MPGEQIKQGELFSRNYLRPTEPTSDSPSRYTFAAAIAAMVCAGANAEGGVAPAVDPGTKAYAAAIRACIRPHILFAVPPGTPDSAYAQFNVELTPIGEQASPPTLVKPSGVPGYDDAALQAIVHCNPFPHDKDHKAPRRVILKMYPTDLPPGKGAGGG